MAKTPKKKVSPKKSNRTDVKVVKQLQDALEDLCDVMGLESDEESKAPNFTCTKPKQLKKDILKAAEMLVKPDLKTIKPGTYKTLESLKVDMENIPEQLIEQDEVVDEDVISEQDDNSDADVEEEIKKEKKPAKKTKGKKNKTEKKEKKEKYVRVNAFVDVMKKGKALTKQEIMQKANKLFVEKGGKDEENRPWETGMFLSPLLLLGVVVKEGIGKDATYQLVIE
jgi:hypothetical protein